MLKTQYELLTFPAVSNLSGAGRPSGGFIIGWCRELTQFIKVLKHLRSAVFIELSLPNNKPILITFIYFSPDRDFRRRLDEVFQEIHGFSHHYKDLMVLGDANARLGQLNAALGKRRQSKDSTANDKGKVLLSWANELGLQVANGAFNGDRAGEIIYISSSNHGSSVIDLLLYSLSLASLICSFRVLDLVHSSHFPILVTINEDNQVSPPTREIIRVPVTKNLPYGTLGPEGLLHYDTDLHYGTMTLTYSMALLCSFILCH
jgi:hypothetical protein